MNSSIERLARADNVLYSMTAVALFGVAIGILYPLLSLTLAAAGYPNSTVGSFAAMGPVGILLASILIPRAAKRYQPRSVAIYAAIATVITIFTYKLSEALTAWLVLRLVQGMSIAALLVLCESWIVRFSSPERRARIAGLYASISAASFAIGSAIVGCVGIEGWLPFMSAALITAAALVPLFLIRDKHQTTKEETKSSLTKIASKAPTLLLAVGTFAAFDAAALTLLPVYALRVGFDNTVAATILVPLVAGNIVLQFPIGWLADLYPVRRISAGCALVSALICITLPLVTDISWIWALLVGLGSTSYALYTLGLAELGNRFKSDEILNGSAAFATVWGIGALAGSLLGGWSMVVIGPSGLPLVFTIAFLGLMMLLGVGELRRATFKFD